MLTLLLLVSLTGASQTREPLLVAKLGDRSLRVRSEAVVELNRSLMTDRAIPSSRSLQEAIVKCLERENEVIESNFEAVKSGAPSELSEEYAEYYALLLGLSNAVRKQAALEAELSQQLKRALVFGSYNPESDFAKELAKEGEAIAPFVLELSQASISPMKWNAYGLIGEIFASSDARRLSAPLSASTAAALRARAREGLTDPASDVRIWAVFAVLKARDKGAIPTLERLAATDPDSSPTGHSVRSVAAEALRRLR